MEYHHHHLQKKRKKKNVCTIWSIGFLLSYVYFSLVSLKKLFFAFFFSKNKHTHIFFIAAPPKEEKNTDLREEKPEMSAEDEAMLQLLGFSGFGSTKQ